MSLKVKNSDVVEVLSGCSWTSLVGSTGVVTSALSSRIALVDFQQKKHYTDPTNLPKPAEVFLSKTWAIPFKYLKVLDSPMDSRLGDLEEEILGLESDLVTARCCVSMSEELREQQHNLIQKLIEEIDVLKQELYLERGGYK